MTKDEALKLALQALEYEAQKGNDNAYQSERKAIKAALEANEFNPDWDTQAVLVEEIQRMAKRIEELEANDKPYALEASMFSNDRVKVDPVTGNLSIGTPQQEAKDEPVQVSPLQFVEMVMEKEHLVGKPIFWAEWPNKGQA
jgi:hypothetical protein